MRLLFVTTRPPLPRSGGAGLRGYHFIRHLGRRHEVHVICHASVREELELRHALGEACAGIQGLPPPPPRALWMRAAQTATSVLPDLAYRSADAAVSRAVACFMKEHAPHIVHVMGLEAAPSVFLNRALAGEARGARRVLDELNAEYLLQDRAFRLGLQQPLQWGASAYSLVQSLKLRRLEHHLCKAADAVVAVSTGDQEALEQVVSEGSVWVVPNGVETDRYCPSRRVTGGALPGVPPDAQVLLFTGSMDFRPNIDAVQWFTGEVLPEVVAAAPRAHLVIAGREPPASVWSLAGEHVTVTGSVPDDLPFFQRADAFVLPMRFGGGSRLKLLQALASGLPVVTTPMGASGIDLTPGEHATVAGSRDEFTLGVLNLLQDRGGAQQMGQRGRDLALRYDWEKVIPRLEQVYEAVLSQPRGA